MVNQNSIHYITRIKIIKDNPVLTTETGGEKREDRGEKSKVGRMRIERERHWLLLQKSPFAGLSHPGDNHHRHFL
jgi:hypothetical protein